MVGVKMREQNVHRVGVGVTLQRAEYATAEIHHQRRGVGRRHEVAGGWRIWPDNTAGATEYGDSHTH